MYIRIFGGLDRGGQWGLGQDARLVEMALRLAAGKMRGTSSHSLRIEHCDPVTWGNRTEPADLQIHLEIPCRVAMPWASFNVAVVNPEWWVLHAWDWCFLPPAQGGFDRIVFKSTAATALFPEVKKSQRLIMNWWTDMTVNSGIYTGKEERFLYIVGGSKSKEAAASILVGAWDRTWPPLEIWCPSATAETLTALVPPRATVFFQTEYKTKEEKEDRQRACRWHVVASAAEGFGFTAAEAAACGAPMLWTDLPIYRDTWFPDPDLLSLGRIPTVLDISEGGSIGLYREDRRTFAAADVSGAVHSLLAMDSTDVFLLQKHYAERIRECRSSFLDGWARVLELKRQSGLGPRHYLPSGPTSVDEGRVGVITVTKDREAWWPNMVANVTGQKWPSAKIVWLLVDDGGLAPQVAALQSKKIVEIVHVIVPEPASIGLKRNRAVAAAPTDVMRFVVMDDDDHYPAESIARRLPWISKEHPAVFCATLPMYDLRRYISAMNVPPLTLSVSERVSEASMAFTREFWTTRPFPEVSMAEGEDFIKGREHEAVEIPPYGIIVSFIHGSNASGRRVPEDQEPNGCHYGFKDEYFKYLHGLIPEDEIWHE
jgi:hypothetical protein